MGSGKQTAFLVSIFVAAGSLVASLVFRVDGQLSVIISLLSFLVSAYATEILFPDSTLAERLMARGALWARPAIVKSQGLQLLANHENERRILRQGRIIIKSESECMRIWRELVDTARGNGNTLKATSYVSPERIWTPTLRECTAAFVGRKGLVKRLFIVPSNAHSDEIEATKREIKAQEAIGVSCGIRRLDDRNRELMRDFILDETQGLAIEFFLDGGAIASGVITCDRSALAALSACFDALESLGPAQV